MHGQDVVCVCVCVCVCLCLSLCLCVCVIADSLATPSMGFPRQDTGVGCHFLLHVFVCVYTDGILLSHKKNEIMPFVATRMELEK